MTVTGHQVQQRQREKENEPADILYFLCVLELGHGIFGICVTVF